MDHSAYIHTLGAAIRTLRAGRSLSQLGLALKSGVDRRYMSDLENGKRNPSLSVVAKIAEALGISAAQLLRYAEKYSILYGTTASLKNLREYLLAHGCEETVIMENPDYLSAIIGITPEGRLVYSYELMVEHLQTMDGMTAEEAAEFIDYNTIRAIPYMGEKAPIVIYELEY